MRCDDCSDTCNSDTRYGSHSALRGYETTFNAALHNTCASLRLRCALHYAAKPHSTAQLEAHIVAFYDGQGFGTSGEALWTIIASQLLDVHP